MLAKLEAVGGGEPGERLVERRLHVSGTSTSRTVPHCSQIRWWW